MSIRKRSWKTAAGQVKDAWIADYVDQTGTRHIKTFDRKKEAESFLTNARHEVAAGTHTPDSRSITIADAAEKWIESCESRELEASTIAAYKQHANLHIIPLIGRKKLSEITAPAVREFEDHLRQGREGLPRSPAMVRKILTSLGSLIGDAQERGLVARNVVRDVRSKRKGGIERRADRRQKGKLKVGIDIPMPTEIKSIIGALQGRWRPFMLTAIFTGLRASELRGLRWVNVDLKKGELHVRERADRYNAMGAPKSESGERTVPLPPYVIAALREWKLACPKSDAGLVFPTSTGHIEHHTNIVKRALIPIQIAAGVTTPVLDENGKPKRGADGQVIVAAKYTGLHALRHFYASWCINRKADGGLELPAKVVQERLGHSSIVMTMDVYGHLFPRGDDSAELAAAEKALIG